MILFYSYNQNFGCKDSALLRGTHGQTEKKKKKRFKKNHHTAFLSKFYFLFQLANIKNFSPGLYNLLKY